MNQSRSAIALYMALVFVSGSVLGIVGDRFYNAKEIAPVAQGKGKFGPGGPTNPADRRKGYLDFMQKRFNLTPAQMTKLGSIADETSALMDDVHRRQAPEQQEILRSQEVKIRDILDTAQRAEYDKRVDRMNKDREERKLKGKGQNPH
jgi:polyhydroxyalkanoate synthesis regulator phasin